MRHIEHEHDDRLQMLRARNGDQQAFVYLYEKHYGAVCDFVRSRNGERTPVADIAQEVFTRTWAGRDRYEARSKVRTFPFGVAKNVLREETRRIRKAEAIRHLETQIQKSLARADSQDPALPLEQHEQIQTLMAAMASLPRRQRQAVELVHFLEISPRTAAGTDGCSLQAFRSRLRRGVQRLAQVIDRASAAEARKRYEPGLSEQQGISPNDVGLNPLTQPTAQTSP